MTLVFSCREMIMITIVTIAPVMSYYYKCKTDCSYRILLLVG